MTEAEPKVKWSSGVAFKPHPKYWRIGNKYYDLTPFLDKHPGGRQLLELARDRFEDATYAFEAHHHNQQKVRAVLSKYEVKDVKVPKDTLHKFPTLTKEGDFYYVLRERVSAYLKTVGGPGPTQECLILWWVTVAAWIVAWSLLFHTGSYKAAIFLGYMKAIVGGFGHNWVHQHKYRNWAYIGLDLLGLSSEGWIREHLLQHHMYTNTPLDNHWDGTSPFLVVDQTCERSLYQKYITPYMTPILLFFGIPANFFAHLTELLSGNEEFSVGKLFLPLQFALLYQKWGFDGIFMLIVSIGFASIYYFTIALMNHNTEHTWDIDAKNSSKDWGEAQLNSSADIGT